jgi:hypothetical protein
VPLLGWIVVNGWRWNRLGLLTAATATVAIAWSGGTATGVSRPTPVQRPFASTSVWNQSLRRDLRPTRASQRLVTGLETQVGRFGATIATTAYSTPVYRVSANQQRVRVRLERPVYPGTSPYALDWAFRAVPIPPSARPAAGSDRHMVIWQRSTDTMWEFWHARIVEGRWYAGWGGRIRHLSASPGYYTGRFDDWGATATSLPLLGGLMTQSELQTGHIHHALAIAVPAVAARPVVWPAQRTDGRSRAWFAIPEGTRFRLRSNVDLKAMHLSPPTLAIAEAVQRYGMIVRDGGGAVAFYAEAPKHGQTNPYVLNSGPFRGLAPWEILARFPWQDLEVVKQAHT